MRGEIEKINGLEVYQSMSCSSIMKYFGYVKSQNKKNFTRSILTPDKYLTKNKHDVYRLVGSVSAYDIAFEVLEKWLGVVKVVNEDLLNFGLSLVPEINFGDRNLDVSVVDVDLILVVKPEIKEISYEDFSKVKNIINSYLEIEDFYY
jgi:hypothetical protein